MNTHSADAKSSLGRWIAIAVFAACLIGGALAASPASAAHRCVPYWLWSDDEGNTWQFTRCNGMVTVVRAGGSWGQCTRTYPPGSRATSPEEVCGYHGPL